MRPKPDEVSSRRFRTSSKPGSRQANPFRMRPRLRIHRPVPASEARTCQLPPSSTRRRSEAIAQRVDPRPGIRRERGAMPEGGQGVCPLHRITTINPPERRRLISKTVAGVLVSVWVLRLEARIVLFPTPPLRAVDLGHRGRPRRHRRKSTRSPFNAVNYIP